MIVCGTGHRPNKLGGYGNTARVKLIDLALPWLMENKPDKVISGMALGWDQALATAAFEANIPYVAAVPFHGQESAWPAESQQQFAQLLKLADEVVYVSDGGYAAYKMQTRNEWMVKNAGLVLALWNGTDGGTANCVRYAQREGKPIVNLWERYEQQATQQH